MPDVSKVIGIETGDISKISGVTIGNVTKLAGQTIQTFANTYSMEFDGSNEMVDLGFYTGTNDVSISCWMKTSESVLYNESRLPFGARPSSGGSHYTLGRIRSQYATPTELNVAMWTSFGTTVLNDGIWHHLVYTFDHTSKEGKAYVDGNATPEATFTFPVWTSNFQPRIGNDPNSAWWFNGNVDECAYFTSVLTGLEVNSIYNSGVPDDLSSLSPVGWWRMGDDASWDGSDWTLTDQGSGGNDGTSDNMEEADRKEDVPA